MIDAKEIKGLVRYKEKDNNEIKWSDYDIKNALNEALRYINQSRGLQNSDFLEKEYIVDIHEINKAIEEENAANEEQKPPIDFAKDGVELPADYLVLVGIIRMNDGHELKPSEAVRIPDARQYKILGNKIYSGAESVKMVYRYFIPSINDNETDKIELPLFLKDCIVKMTCLILNQAETDTLLQSVNSIVSAVIPERRYKNLEKKMPFFV